MTSVADSAKKTSRRRFAKLTLAALGMLAGVPSAPPASGQQRKPKQLPKKREEIEQTSPITIGGGSVSINFDHCWYKDNNPAKPKQYWNQTDVIEKFWIVNEHGSNLPFPQATPEKTITIDCVRNDGHTTQIVVTCKPLGIEFEPVEFPYNPATDVHYNKDWKITKVWISEIAAPVFEAQDGKCLIRIDDPSR